MKIYRFGLTPARLSRLTIKKLLGELHEILGIYSECPGYFSTKLAGSVALTQELAGALNL